MRSRSQSKADRPIRITDDKRACKNPGIYGDKVADTLRRQSSRLASLLHRIEARPDGSEAGVKRWARQTESALKGLALGPVELATAYRDVVSGGLYEWAVRYVEGDREQLLDRLGSVASMVDRPDTSIPSIDVAQVADVVRRWSSGRSTHPVTARVLVELNRETPAPESRTEIREATSSRESASNQRTGPKGKPSRQRGPDRSLMEFLQHLEAIVSHDNGIDWRAMVVCGQWIEIMQRVRAHDRSLAVEVYSYYSTPSETTRALLARERFQGEILEPCSGGGAISRVLEGAGYDVKSSDVREGPDVYGEGGVDARSIAGPVTNVVTNPPFKDSLSLIEHLVSIAERKVAVLLRVDFLAMFVRRPFFRSNPPRTVYVLTERPLFLTGGDEARKQSGKYEFGWFVWDRDRPGSTEMVYVEKDASGGGHVARG